MKISVVLFLSYVSSARAGHVPAGTPAPTISHMPSEWPSAVPSELPSEVPSMLPSELPSEQPSALVRLLISVATTTALVSYHNVSLGTSPSFLFS